MNNLLLTLAMAALGQFGGIGGGYGIGGGLPGGGFPGGYPGMGRDGAMPWGHAAIPPGVGIGSGSGIGLPGNSAGSEAEAFGLAPYR